ncbi:MAG TPA: PIN domain-containing protein [Geminicoccaceae bacterium]|nr:PIN domain-containing protein [Geminicoccaceae bacterium]
MAADPVFIDTNVLVYANQANAIEHARATSLIREAEARSAELWISRQVLREYLSAVTRPQAAGPALPLQVAANRVRWFAQRFRVADETAEVTGNLLSLLDSVPAAGKQVHDANIVATMLAHGIRHLLTFNVAVFRRFETFIAIEPLP